MIPPPPVDLATLLGEMAAVKAEVRAETQASRDLRDQLATAVGELRAELERARAREDRLRAELERARAATRDAEAQRLITLFDKVEALAASARRAPARGMWPRRRVDPAVVALVEGLELVGQRLEAALADLGIARVVTRGAVLDPQRMEAVDREVDPSRPHLAVLDELASGWATADRVLRPAQVIVNHTSAPGGS